MSKSGVYQIILIEDGRSYIGSAIDIESRWRQHKEKAKRSKDIQVIARAIKKYGAGAFEWVILEECDCSQLIKREQYWLDLIRPFVDENNGFNVRKIADSNLGVKRTAESRRKQSNTMAGIPKTEEHKANLSKNWHRNRSSDYYAALSERVKGDKNPAKNVEVREKISKAMTGKTWKSDTARVQKHIEQRLGVRRSAEAREKMKIAQQKNKSRSAEAREKFYLAQRVLYQIQPPHGELFQMYSRELKVFCKDNQLSYANLITTAKTNKLYKGGWQASVVL